MGFFSIRTEIRFDPCDVVMTMTCMRNDEWRNMDPTSSTRWRMKPYLDENNLSVWLLEAKAKLFFFTSIDSIEIGWNILQHLFAFTGLWCDKFRLHLLHWSHTRMKPMAFTWNCIRCRHLNYVFKHGQHGSILLVFTFDRLIWKI